MKVPNYVFFLVIPIFAGAVTPVIAQFYPVDKVFWSALLVAVLGAVVSAIAAVRQAQPPVQPPAGAVSIGAPDVKQQFVKRWFVGA